VEREITWQTYGQTIVHPVALAFTIAMGIWLLRARRDRAVLPIMLVACLIPVIQRVVVASLDFNMVRILILFGWARLLVKGEARDIRWHRLDTAFVAYLGIGTLTYVAREVTVSALVYRLGVAFEAMGIYFLLRALLRSSAEVLRSVYQLAAIAGVVGVSMLVENVTGRNLFAVFGGVHEYTVIRDGRLRCQGAFSHPIMAGSFGATLAPIFAMVALGQRNQRPLLVAGLVGSIVIAITAASSGPVLALLTAIAGCGLFPIRNHMRLFRYGVVAVLAVLHVIREAPVWQLIGRASDLIGGTGYHRVRLIDGFIYNWREWFLVGTPSTAGWGWGLQDLTNQFVYEGVQGGILTLAAFVAVLALGFGSMGRTIQRAQAAPHLSGPRRLGLEMLAWGLGVSLATHCVSWISVSYFGQMTLVFHALLALIVTTAQTPELSPSAAREVRAAREARPAGAATPGRPGEPPAGRAREPRLVDVR
jgi:hypothetical protein